MPSVGDCVDDEIGHKLEVNVVRNKVSEVKSKEQDAGPILGHLPEYERAIIGISIIFGISGILFWRRGRRIYRKINKEHGWPLEFPKEK